MSARSFTVTGVGPRQANGSARTSISREPGSQINPEAGGVAINPSNFGVSDARGNRRAIFGEIRLYPDWGNATSDASYAPQEPAGLPASGPYRPIDVIPGDQRHPGNQIDLYRYSKQAEAMASTRTVPIRSLIPTNNEGVTCPE